MLSLSCAFAPCHLPSQNSKVLSNMLDDPPAAPSSIALVAAPRVSNVYVAVYEIVRKSVLFLLLVIINNNSHLGGISVSDLHII